jgi:hypothetical protein
MHEVRALIEPKKQAVGDIEAEDVSGMSGISR